MPDNSYPRQFLPNSSCQVEKNASLQRPQFTGMQWTCCKSSVNNFNDRFAIFVLKIKPHFILTKMQRYYVTHLKANLGRYEGVLFCISPKIIC